MIGNHDSCSELLKSYHLHNTMNDYRIAQLKVGYWTVCIDEIQSEANFEIVQRDFHCFKLDSMGKPINEHFQDLLECIEFAQLNSGMLVFGYPELEQLSRMAQVFWAERIGGSVA